MATLIYLKPQKAVTLVLIILMTIVHTIENVQTRIIKTYQIKNLFDLLLSLKTIVNKYMLRVDATYAKRKENVK